MISVCRTISVLRTSTTAESRRHPPRRSPRLEVIWSPVEILSPRIVTYAPRGGKPINSDFGVDTWGSALCGRFDPLRSHHRPLCECCRLLPVLAFSENKLSSRSKCPCGKPQQRLLEKTSPSPFSTSTVRVVADDTHQVPRHASITDPPHTADHDSELEPAKSLLALRSGTSDTAVAVCDG